MLYSGKQHKVLAVRAISQKGITKDFSARSLCDRVINRGGRHWLVQLDKHPK
jgi:hypothetical protein